MIYENQFWITFRPFFKNSYFIHICGYPKFNLDAFALVTFSAGGDAAGRETTNNIFIRLQKLGAHPVAVLISGAKPET